MGCHDIPSIQLGARGASIDFLFQTKADDGTVSAVDLSNAIDAAGETFALFRKPRVLGAEPEIVKVSLSVVAPASGGRARYTSADGFFDVAGEWSAQGFVTFSPAGPSGSFIPSEVVIFTVKPNLRPFTPVPTLEPASTELPLEAPSPTVT